MKRMLLGFCLGTVVISGGMRGSGIDAGSQELLKENNLSYVCEANIAKGKVEIAKSIKLFSVIQGACAALVVGSILYTLYDFYIGVKSRSTLVRLDALEAATFKEETIEVPDRNTGEMVKTTILVPRVPFAKGSEPAPKSWFSSAKSIFTGLPTQIMTTMVSGATLGLLNAKIPIPELLKSEPSFGWFLTHKTGFAAECGILMVYYQKQAVHDAFCVETARLVGDVEKILGYVDYQIAQIKKSSSMAAKVLASRRQQLISMTNKLVDLVAQKQYEEMMVAVQLLNGFVHEGLTAGILQ